MCAIQSYGQSCCCPLFVSFYLSLSASKYIEYTIIFCNKPIISFRQIFQHLDRNSGVECFSKIQMILVFSRSRGKRLRSGLRGPRIPSDHRGSWVMRLIPKGGLTSQVETWKMLEYVESITVSIGIFLLKKHNVYILDIFSPFKKKKKLFSIGHVRAFPPNDHKLTSQPQRTR